MTACAEHHDASHQDAGDRRKRPATRASTKAAEARAQTTAGQMRRTIESWYGRSTDLGMALGATAPIRPRRGPWGPDGTGPDLEAVEKEGWT